MIDNISINYLRYFVKVVETKNITAAAEELFLTQPTLSRKIAKLEEDIGKKLLVRNTKGIELTQDGIAFYEQCKRIIAALSDINNSENLEHSITGLLKLGYQRPTLGYIIGFNSSFVKKHPNVRLNTIKLGRQNVVNELLFGDLDASIIYEHELKGYHKQLNNIHVGCCKMAVMVSKSHPLANRKVVHIKELASEKFIQLDRNIAPVKIDEFYKHCEKNGFSPMVIRVEREHMDIVADVVTFGAVSLAPIPKRNNGNANSDASVDETIKYIDLEGFDTDYPVCLAWRVDNANPALPVYVENVKEQVEKSREEC